MEKTELQIEWERRIDIFKASGQSQSKWCKVKNLEIPQEPTETLQIKIGEAAIEVKPGFNPSFLAKKLSLVN
jgi:hypothetical protein